jgi:hypothetical protein
MRNSRLISKCDGSAMPDQLGLVSAPVGARDWLSAGTIRRLASTDVRDAA